MNRSRASRVCLAVTLAMSALAGCVPIEPSSGTSTTTTASAPSPGASLDSEDAAQVAAARRMLSEARIGGKGPRTGYDRAARFGPPWADVDRNGCGTRDDVLVRDLDDVVKRSRCVVVGGVLDDPYTGRRLTFTKADAMAVQIDHVVPLALSWQLGAAQWEQGKRVAFANDPLNLVAVDGPTNGAKSDSGPDAWLPPNKPYRCTYAIRFTRVVDAYDLRVTRSMRDMLSSLLDRCRAVEGRPATLPSLPRSSWAFAGRIGGGKPATPAPVDPRDGPAGQPTGYACPKSAPIKGNESSSGDLIYHRPGQQAYDETKPERCFASADAAEHAGFRPARR